ncbi:MAG: glycosyltransferase, partial [Gemmatimonadetes bacterium]|nr:glycosyltransferase [Gemmatimonadota bacterium]
MRRGATLGVGAMTLPTRAPRPGGVLHLRRSPLLRPLPGMAFAEAMEWARRGGPLRTPFPYDEAHLHVHDAERMTRPLLASLLVRAAGRRAWIEDDAGGRRAVGAAEIARRAAAVARDLARAPGLRRRVERRVARLERETAAPPPPGEGPPLYLRTDLWFGVRTGGAAAHVAGVVNHLGDFFAPPVVLSTDDLPLVRPEVEVHRVRPPAEFWDFRELPNLRFNEFFPPAARRLLGGRRPGWVYQRYSEYDFAGVELARGWGVPLVLEFNAPALWVARHWGSGLRYEALADRIERLALRSAARVVVVSEPLAALVRERGVPAERILVNPNGVEPDRFTPAADGARVRARLGLEGRVVGFIGTFG